MKIAQKQQNLSRVPKQLRKHSFKPGKSANPGGIPKHGRIDKTIRDFMGDKEKLELVSAMYSEAVDKGNVQAAHWLADRGWGKVTEKIDFNENKLISIELIKEIRESAELPGVINVSRTSSS